MSTNEWYDDIDTNAVLWAGLISIIVFIALVLGVQALYFAWNNYEVDRKQIDVEPAKSIAILDAQRLDLSEYKSFKVGDTTKIAIPIDRAMDLVAKDLIESK